MKSNKVRYLLCLLFFAVLAAITFRCVWPADHVFSASDLNIGRLAFIKNLLPAYLTGFFHGNDWFGSSGSQFSLFAIMLQLLPAELFGNLFYGAFLVAGSMVMVWFLRLWNRSWSASVVGALIAFWVNSIMLAESGHIFKIEVLVFSVLSLVFIEKAVRSAGLRRVVGFSLLTGICVGIMMIEQQDVALLAGLFVFLYMVFRLITTSGRAVMRWVAVVVPIGGVALLLAGSTMLKSYEHNIAKATSVQGESEDKWNFITQWSLVPDEWPDLIAPGWGGWSSNNPDGPYWGKLGQSAEWPESQRGMRNFKLTSNYFGIIPFLLGIFGFIAALRNRTNEEGKAMLFWSAAGVIGFWLAFGKFSLLYKLFYQLPLIGAIRAPIKLLDNFQICLAIVAAYGLDGLLSMGKGWKPSKGLWIASSVFGGFMLLAGLKFLVFPASQQTIFTQMGFEPFAKVMVNNMAHAWLHGAVLAVILAGLVFVVWKGFASARWVGLALITVLAADSLVLTSHFFKSTDISDLKNGNLVVNFIKENQGNERTYFMDSNGLYNQWIASDGPFHDLNLFNTWQMPRVPADYEEFFQAMGRNPIRLWELAAVKYVAFPGMTPQQFSQNPELANQFQSVLSYQVPTHQGMRPDVLAEFKEVIPRFALFHGWKSVPPEEQCKLLASPAHHVQSGVLVDPVYGLGDQPSTERFKSIDAVVTKRSATMTVQSEGPAIVRFSQYYQPGWKVYVDGESVTPLRVDFLCLGVAVPPGEHVIVFQCPSSASKALFTVIVFVAALVISGWLLHSKNKVNAIKDDA